MLGLIIEQVSNESFEAFIDREILMCASLKASVYNSSKKNNIAYVYTRVLFFIAFFALKQYLITALQTFQ